MKRISQYFLNGLLVTVPLAVTIFVVYTLFVKVDSLFHFSIPGLGVGATILIIFLTGVAASSLITKQILGFIDILFARLPLVKMIYTSIKDLVSAFVGDKKTFNKPVLVSLSREDTTQAIGFVTRASLSELGFAEKSAVYFPQSFNFAGNILVVPADQIEPIDADPGEVMSLIVSGGISMKSNTQ